MALPIPSAETQLKARKVVEEFIEHAEPRRNEKISQMEELYNNYMVKPSKETGRQSGHGGTARNVDSFSHEAVETIMPRIFDVLTRNGMIKYEVTPVGPEDEPFVKVANALIKHDFKIANMRSKIIEGIRYVTKYGTGVDFTPWKKNIRRRLVPQRSIRGVEFDGDVPIYKEHLDGYEIQETILSEGVALEPIDLRSCWLDPFQPDVQKAQAIVIQENIALEDLQREKIRIERERIPHPDGSDTPAFVERAVGHYFNLDKLEELLKHGSQIKEQSAGATQTRDQTEITPKKRAKVKHYYGRFDKGDGDADYIIAIAEKDLVIRCDVSDLPERPAIVYRYIPIEGETYGLGMLEIDAVGQIISSDLFGQFMDNVTMTLDNMWKVKSSSGITDDMLTFIPRGTVPVDNMDDIESLAPQNVTGVAIDAMIFQNQRRRDALGVAKILTSSPLKTNATATEAQISRTEAFARILMGAINIEEERISPLLRRTIEYNHRFMGDEKIIRITNDETGKQEFLTVTQEALAARFDYTPMGATNHQRKQEQRENFQNFLQDVAFATQINPGVLEQLQGRGFDLALMIKEFAKLNDIPNLENIFPEQEQQGEQGVEGGTNGETDELTQAMQQLVGAGVE